MLKHSLAFAAMFAIAAVGVVAILVLLAPEPPPRERFVTDLAALIIGVQAAIVAATCGATTGALYGLVPKSARDMWMAMAFGVGGALAPIVATRLSGVYPLSWVLGVAALAAVASACATWIVRRIEMG
jgi:hypothetical protein